MLCVLLLFVPYQCAMLYGLFMLGSFWSSRSLRGIPDPLFLLFGLMAPLIGWFISIFAWPFFWVVPGSLGFMYWWAKRHTRSIAEGADGVRVDERENAHKMLAADAQNAAAHWSLGQICESERKYDEALFHYAKANSIDERTVPKQELADIRDRIASAIELERDNPFLEEELRAGRRRERLENGFLLVGAALFFVNWVYAVNLCSMMLFIRWFSPVKRAGTLLS